MKILVIDDQHLILLSVEKRLSELGYSVSISDSARSGMQLFDQKQPDLVILDLNMPDMSGIEVIRHIRQFRNSDIPILILSGNTRDDVITAAYELGVNDFMKKPVSLNEVCARIRRLTKGNFRENRWDVPNVKEVLQKYCVGVVIPCYNEAERLSGDAFREFTATYLGYHLCFVNDGSTDNTLEVLRELQQGRENYISIVNLEQNSGKAEAVRQGTLALSQVRQIDYLGYLDADLSTNFEDFDKLVQTLSTGKYKLVSGSRISRVGAQITKKGGRQLISMAINRVIRALLKLPFQDTQCGAKVMPRELAGKLFEDPFKTTWLFDVELFMRFRNTYGKKAARELLCEQPLDRWDHADGSKLSVKDSFKILGQLGTIARSY